MAGDVTTTARTNVSVPRPPRPWRCRAVVPLANPDRPRPDVAAGPHVLAGVDPVLARRPRRARRPQRRRQSTPLRTLAGLHPPESGTVTTAPPAATVGYRRRSLRPARETCGPCSPGGPAWCGSAALDRATAELDEGDPSAIERYPGAGAVMALAAPTSTPDRHRRRGGRARGGPARPAHSRFRRAAARRARAAAPRPLRRLPARRATNDPTSTGSSGWSAACSGCTRRARVARPGVPRAHGHRRRRDRRPRPHAHPLRGRLADLPRGAGPCPPPGRGALRPLRRPASRAARARPGAAPVGGHRRTPGPPLRRARQVHPPPPGADRPGRGGPGPGPRGRARPAPAGGEAVGGLGPAAPHRRHPAGGRRRRPALRRRRPPQLAERWPRLHPGAGVARGRLGRPLGAGRPQRLRQVDAAARAARADPARVGQSLGRPGRRRGRDRPAAGRA